MTRDRHRIVQRLRKGQPADRIIAQSIETAARRQAAVPTKIVYDEALPVVQRREELAAAIREHQVIVISGETGSGKTTQLPKICMELGRGVHGMIGHTQPRRIAARSVATRVAQELGTPLGETVGFQVRFSDVTSPNTLVKLMTDGILLAEVQSDKLLSNYDTIIIDEAHERSLNIDFLLGHLRNILPQRPDLKLIITSATIDPHRFAQHFAAPGREVPVIEVSGRTYDVEVRYRPLQSDDPDQAFVEMYDAIIGACDELGRDAVTYGGDTLVFLTGEREIRETADQLRGHYKDRVDILPLYARLSAEEQMRVFKTSGRRRIVLATNVAETSLTVPGIRGVVDTGIARISRYSARNRLQRLPIEAISQASADQRKGRCGRIAEGICVRLYGEEDFTLRPRFTDPEILRTNLAQVILQMTAFGLGRIEDFPFIDPPDPRHVRDGYETLREIGAIDENYRLTEIGRTLARLPIDPRVGRMILAARQENALHEVLIIAAALSVQDPRERPMEAQKQADAAHHRHRGEGSDFLTLLNLWRFWREDIRTLSGSQQRKQSRANYLSYVRLREWQDVHHQLLEVVTQLNWPMSREAATSEAVHRSLLHGLLPFVGMKTDKHEYTGLRNRKFFIFPGSGLFQTKPPWVMAAEMVETTRVYARNVAAIDPKWIEDIAAPLLKKRYDDPHWRKKTGRVTAYMTATLHGLMVVHRRTVNYANVSPVTARQIFIRSALVEGGYESAAPFFRHNADLLLAAQMLEAKGRRRDILADADTRYAFYDARVPGDVTDAKSFEKWRSEVEQHDRRLLFMRPEDLMARTPGELELGAFPDELAVDGLTLPLTYHFEPGHREDGVTVTVPLAALPQLPADRLDWLVPGLLEEKCVDLIRTLPKPTRVKLVPVPDTARRAVRMLRFGEGSLFSALADALGKATGAVVPPSEFRPMELPDFLKMNVRVVDEHQKTVAMGRDFTEIRRNLKVAARETFAAKPPPPYDRSGITKWDFGEIPERVEFRSNGQTLQGYPAVVDEGQSVCLRLLESPEAARAANRLGVRRLFLLDYDREVRHHIRQLRNFNELKLTFAPLAGGGFKKAVKGAPPAAPAVSLEAQLAEAVSDRLVQEDPANVRTVAAFEIRVQSAWNRVRPVAEQVGTIAMQVLQTRQAILKLLDRVIPPMLQPNVDDVAAQLRFLCPPTFLTSTPLDRLAHLPRYMTALHKRLEKLFNAGLTRDNKQLDIIRPLDLALEAMALNPEANAAAITRLRWQMQELRVQLFALECGVAEKVSPAKIETALAALQ